ncbi:hypothetical protein O6H91_01G067300 [Diphasiastrum complanatum]|nr:hypothetical protein O6H91_01G067300 [Diphasiastrum complanatum]
MAEREAAIMEKATALADKKTALTERDSALLQRDLAISDRDSASIERDRAMAALNLIRAEQEACPHCHWNRRSAYNTAAGSSKYALMVGVPENIQPLAAIAKTEELFLESAAAPKKKRKRSSKPKEEGKASRPKKEKKEASLSSPAKPSAKSLHGTLQERNPPGQEKTQKTPTDNQLLANGAFHIPLFDCSKIPSPYCSCTGMSEQCYRWGSGGWQSACCTNMISMYPLPMSPKKKGCRVAGRKMSAGAFERLLQRLVSEGWDLNMPVDLKDYWAKHGTNRYVTIK